MTEIINQWGVHILGVFSALIAALWAQVNRRIARQEDNVAKLFDKLESHTRDDNEQFRSTLATVNANHIELMRYLRDKNGDQAN